VRRETKTCSSRRLNVDAPVGHPAPPFLDRSGGRPFINPQREPVTVFIARLLNDALRTGAGSKLKADELVRAGMRITLALLERNIAGVEG
jgi:hypothetical protein